MTYLSRSLVLFVIVVLITTLVPIFGCPRPGQGQSNLTSRTEALEAQVAALEAKLAHVSVEQGSLNGLNGPHLIIEGCNLHVRSGSGDTADDAGLTGLGNFVVGYNEQPDPVVHGRLGSHNLIVGMQHEYANYGGFVAGERNAVPGAAATVSGGTYNEASGDFSSVSGGSANTAGGSLSSVSGGGENTASSLGSSVSGGAGNTASSRLSSVSGGLLNTASSSFSTVSGGRERTAPNAEDWAAGSLFEDF